MKLSGIVHGHGLKTFQRKNPFIHGRRAPRIWIVVADEKIAKIFKKMDGHIELIGTAMPEADVESGLDNEFLGRMVSAAGSTLHHKFEPHMEESFQPEIVFAREFSRWLNFAETQDTFDRLVLIAEPKTLGYLRSFMPKAVESRIVAEIDKDYTKLRSKELRAALNDLVWF